MSFKVFKRTAAKAFIWMAVFFIGSLAITVHFGVEDPAILKEQSYGLILGAFVGLMANYAYYVYPFNEKAKKE